MQLAQQVDVTKDVPWLPEVRILSIAIWHVSSVVRALMFRFYDWMPTLEIVGANPTRAYG